MIRTYFTKCISTIGFVIKYSCIAHCTCEFVADLVVCSGPSMEPTIYSDDILLTDHISPQLRKIRRGDVVIAKCPSNPKENICKRVVGLPGDKIYVGFIGKIVPRGYVWLEGDNSNNSTDSRSYGAVPLGLIRSKALCKIWPLNDISLLNR